MRTTDFQSRLTQIGFASTTTDVRQHHVIGVDPHRDLATIYALDSIKVVAMSSMPSAGALSEVAGRLRMLLLDREVAKCAASHGIRLEIVATDNRFINKARPLSSVSFFMSGGCTISSVEVDPFAVSLTGGAVPPITSGLTRRLKLAEFLDDPVLCVRGRLIKRADVIRYVANKLGGVHYDDRRQKETERAIDRARSAVTLRLEGKEILQEVNFDYLNDTAPPLQFLPSRLDCAMIQIFATCVMLDASPSIGVLSTALRGSVARAQTKPM
jgi:hypothetical protein